MKITRANLFSSFNRGSIDNLILSIAKSLALCGGLVLLLMVFVNLMSILGRGIFGAPLVGDFELIELACGISIFMFLPLCKLKDGNIILDIFTVRLSKNKQIFLDLIGDALFGLVAIFFSYRMIFGLLDMIRYKEETMLLEIPVWISFGPAIFSLFFLAVICFFSVITKLLTLVTRSEQ